MRFLYLLLLILINKNTVMFKLLKLKKNDVGFLFLFSRFLTVGYLAECNFFAKKPRRLEKKQLREPGLLSGDLPRG